MSRRLAILSLVAFLLNVGIHLLTFVDGVSLSLGTTWPVFVVTLLLAFAAVGVKIRDTSHDAIRMAKMSQDQMVEQVRSGLNRSGWTRFFGTTPTWTIMAIPVLFIVFGASLIFDGIPGGTVNYHESEDWVFDLNERPVRKATAAEIAQSQIAELRMVSSGFALFAMVAFVIFSGRSAKTASEVTETESEQPFDPPVLSRVDPQREWNKEAEGSLEIDDQIVNFEFSSCLVFTEEDLAGNLEVMVRASPSLPAEKLSGNLQLLLPGLEQLIESDAYGYCGDGIAEISFAPGNSGIRFDDVRETIMSIRDVEIFWCEGRNNKLATLPCEFAFLSGGFHIGCNRGG
jgi:hypothetical protein